MARGIRTGTDANDNVWQQVATGTVEPAWELIDFPVAKRDLYFAEGRNRYPIPERKAVVRQDDGTVLQIVSADYKLVPHKQAFEPIAEAIHACGMPVSKVETNVGNDGGYARVLWTMDLNTKVQPRRRSLPGFNGGKAQVGDVVALQVVARNAMNYNADYSVSFGAERLVCENGMVVFIKAGRIGGKHFASLSVADIIAELNAHLQDTDRAFPMLTRWQQWAGVQLEVPMLTQWLAKKANPKVVSKEAAETIVDYYKVRDNTLWEGYNAITWYATHKVPVSRKRQAGRMVTVQELYHGEAARLVRAFENS